LPGCDPSAKRYLAEAMHVLAVKRPAAVILITHKAKRPRFIAALMMRRVPYAGR
jgi:hypothetical protein